jgi:tetratricopeptide (TPR) repeat protein
MRHHPERRTTASIAIARAKIVVGKNSAGYWREVVLVVCFGLMLVLLTLTAFISRMYHKEVHVLADQWFARGEASFQAGDAADAVKDYRDALLYSPGNPEFQLHLAQALIAAGKYDEARSYLLNLLTESPGSGEINLELARIASHERGSVQDALRYYNAAIYGVWESNAIQVRWNVRREFCEYLLALGNTNRAEPEIIALAQDVPPGDLARQKEAGALLLRAKLWNRAFDEYRAILTTHRHDADALAGAGTAAFQMGDYARAAQYFGELPREKRADPAISSMLETIREVEAASPFLPKLSSQERARRTVEALERAQGLAQDCSERQGVPLKASPPSTPLQKLWATLDQDSSLWTQQNIVRDPDQIDAAMEWVFQVESAAQQACGESQNSADRALLLLAQSQTRAEPGMNP